MNHVGATVVCECAEKLLEAAEGTHVVCELALLFMELKHNGLYQSIILLVNRINERKLPKLDVVAPLGIEEIGQIEPLSVVDRTDIKLQIQSRLPRQPILVRVLRLVRLV